MPYLSIGLYSFNLQLSICTVGIGKFDYRDSPAVIYDVGKKCPTSPGLLYTNFLQSQPENVNLSFAQWPEIWHFLVKVQEIILVYRRKSYKTIKILCVLL